MNDDDPLLAEQRRILRERLRAQRQQIALKLGPAPPGQDPYPRSEIMRLLKRRPALLAGLVAPLAGARIAGLIPVVVLIVPVLRFLIAVGARRRQAARDATAPAPSTPVDPDHQAR